MRPELEVLDRYFKSFIDTTNDYEFFIGLIDYIAYIDSVPQIEKIANELPKLRIEEENKLKAEEKEVIEELISFRDKLKDEINKNKIKDERIDRKLQDFQWWVEGKSVGSSPLPTSMFRELRDLISILDESGHKDIIKEYVRYYEDNPEYKNKQKIQELFGKIEKYIFSKNWDKYEKARELFNEKMKTELWGQFNDLAVVYLVIVNGKTYHQKLIDEAGDGENRNMQKWWEAFNMTGVLGEWDKLKEHKNSKEHRVFFDSEKHRFYVKRLHNYLAEKLLLTDLNNEKKISGSITDNISVPQNSKMNPVLGILEYRKNYYGFIQLFPRSERIKLGRQETRQYRLFKCLFSPENRESDVSYTPNYQGIDRVFENISLPKDKVNGDLKNQPQLGKKQIIENTIKELQKIKKLQGYLDFEWYPDNSKLRMNIHPKEG